MKPLIEKIRSLKEIYELTDLCVFVKNTEGVIVYSNPAFARFTGYSTSEMLYEQTTDFITNGSSQLAHSAADDALIFSGQAKSTVRTIFIKNGRREPVAMKLTKVPLMINRSEIIGLMGSGIDLTVHYRMHYLMLKERIDALSPGERRVLFFFSRGLDRNEVAKELDVNVSTVDTQKARAKEKLCFELQEDFEQFLLIYNDLIDNIYTD